VRCFTSRARDEKPHRNAKYACLRATRWGYGYPDDQTILAMDRLPRTLAVRVRKATGRDADIRGDVCATRESVQKSYRKRLSFCSKTSVLTNSCSQIRTTVQPSFLSARVTLLSRRMFE